MYELNNNVMLCRAASTRHLGKRSNFRQPHPATTTATTAANGRSNNGSDDERQQNIMPPVTSIPSQHGGGCRPPSTLDKSMSSPSFSRNSWSRQRRLTTVVVVAGKKYSENGRHDGWNSGPEHRLHFWQLLHHQAGPRTQRHPPQSGPVYDGLRGHVWFLYVDWVGDSYRVTGRFGFRDGCVRAVPGSTGPFDGARCRKFHHRCGWC